MGTLITEVLVTQKRSVLLKAMALPLPGATMAGAPPLTGTLMRPAVPK
jgi:hypothetical protein